MFKIKSFYLFVLTMFIIFLSLTGPISQPEQYYLFADQAVQFNIEHFQDVLTNVLFCAFAIYMLLSLSQIKPQYEQEEQVLPIIVLGMFMTGLGSSIFHMTPNVDTLLLDRMPITIMFFGVFFDLLFSLKIIKSKNPIKHVLAAIFIALTTLLYWKFSPFVYKEDLRPYLFVQFFPLICIALLCVYLSRNKELKPKLLCLVSMIFLYLLAKICEHFDFQILNLTGFISGHNLKHILAAIAIMPYWKLKKIQ